MIISVTPISYSASMQGGKTQNDYFDFIAAAGAKGSDILDAAAYPWFWQDVTVQKTDLHKRLSERGLNLTAWATGDNLATNDVELFKKNVDRIKNAIRDAAEMEAPCLRIFGGYHADCGGEKGMTVSRGLKLVEEGISEVLPLAEKEHVVLALENHGRIPGLSYELEYFCKKFNSKYFGLTFDCANFCANNMDETENPLEAYERLKKWIVHCHVKSFCVAPPETGRRSVGCVAGEGYMVPLRQFFYKLASDNYKGACSLEYEGAKYTPEDIGVVRSLANLIEFQTAAQILNA